MDVKNQEKWRLHQEHVIFILGKPGGEVEKLGLEKLIYQEQLQVLAEMRWWWI